jgi:hypothetical protein
MGSPMVSANLFGSLQWQLISAVVLFSSPIAAERKPDPAPNRSARRVFLLSAAAEHADTTTTRPHDLTIHMIGSEIVPFETLSIATGLSARMLSEVDVRLLWCFRRLGQDQNPGRHSMTVEFRNDPQEDALGYTFPYEGTRITIVYARLKGAECQSKVFAAKLLAHTLVHEITHNLQAIARHSATGIMKARWNLEDYHEMAVRPLRFEPIDVSLIRLGLKHWEDFNATVR